MYLLRPVRVAFSTSIPSSLTSVTLRLLNAVVSSMTMDSTPLDVDSGHDIFSSVLRSSIPIAGHVHLGTPRPSTNGHNFSDLLLSIRHLPSNSLGHLLPSRRLANARSGSGSADHIDDPPSVAPIAIGATRCVTTSAPHTTSAFAFRPSSEWRSSRRDENKQTVILGLTLHFISRMKIQ